MNDYANPTPAPPPSERGGPASPPLRADARSPLVRCPLLFYALPMDALTSTLLAALVGVIAWFLRGRFTPAKRSERYDLAGKMLDVREKLKAAGWDAPDIDHFVNTLESDSTGERASSMLKATGLSTTGSTEVVESYTRPSILDTTAAMGARAEARLRVLDAEIEQVLLDIEMVSSHNFSQSIHDDRWFDSNHIRKMHRAWKVYRERAGASASADFFGGSISGIIWLVEQVRISEVFLADMRKRLEDLQS